MDENTKKIKLTAQETPQSIMSKALRITAIPLGVLLGGWTTYINVRASANEKAKQVSPLKEINDDFSKDLENTFLLRSRGAISAEECAERAVMNKAAHTEATTRFMKNMGLDGPIKKWGFIHKANRQKAIVEGLTVAGITVGSMLAVANIKSIKEFFLGDPDEAVDKTR
jgi:hypothetical protein